MPDAAPTMPVLPLEVGAWLDHPQDAIAALGAAARGHLRIDAGEATGLPAQIAQLLLSARLTARQAGFDLWIEPASPRARDDLTTLGLSDLLEAPVTIKAMLATGDAR